jgi:hypothetical protein
MLIANDLCHKWTPNKEFLVESEAPADLDKLIITAMD